MNRFQRACSASNEHFCNYGGNGKPDKTGRLPCPACGKVVLLRAKNGVVGTRAIIPNHVAAKATGSDDAQ